MSLPAQLRVALVEQFGAEPQHVSILSRSATTSAARCQINGRRYLLKWCAASRSAPDPCAAEARGLLLLAQTGTLRVPPVLAQANAYEHCPAFLVTEWIDVPAHADRATAGIGLGHGLAALHRASAPAFGLDDDNFCGPTPQINGWLPSWVEFFRTRRLGFQMQLAVDAGLMPAMRRNRLEQLMARLHEWLPDNEPPSLLHGDLWGGNWLIDTSNAPVLIDPAVYYGHREAELAMCQLFGGFPPEFFAAYDESWPPTAGRDDRVPVYQLYHLLNHLNLFGEGYGAQIDAILRRYVG